MVTVLKRSAAAAALAALLFTGAARADSMLGQSGTGQPLDAITAPPAPITLRGGFTVGADLGVGVASIVGYPNDVQKIGYASYYTVTHARPSAVAELWIGGAFTDWFTFAIGGTFSPILAEDGEKARMFGGIFHLEAFPLFPLGGHLREVGIRLDAGIGEAIVTDANQGQLVNSTLASIIGGGIFYEGLRAGKTAHGPFLMANYLWSETALRPAIFIGWRSVLYTSP